MNHKFNKEFYIIQNVLPNYLQILLIYLLKIKKKYYYQNYRILSNIIKYYQILSSELY
jgi:hypothetical protein